MQEPHLNTAISPVLNEIEAILECSNDAVFVLEPGTYNILQANNNAALLLGLFKDALTEYSFKDFIDMKSQVEWFNHVESIQYGQFNNFSGRIKSFTSKTAVVEAKTRLIRLEDQEVYISFIKEISGFPYQINELKKQIEFYKIILNEMPTQFAVLSPKWRYMFINKLSIKDDDFREWMIGKSDFDFCEYRNKDTSLAQNRLENYQKVAESRVEKEWIEEFQSNEGEQKYILRKLYPYFVKGELYLTFGFGLDITQLIVGKKERQKILESMARKNEELKQFAYIVAHDLKEPLRNISSFSNLLQRRHQDQLTGDAIEFLDFITSNVKRMNSLLSDLTSYVTIDRMEEEKKMADFNDIVFLAKANLQVLLNETNTEITSTNLPNLLCHKTYLVQLIQNLLNNAIKFRRDESPQINISAEMIEGYYEFQVKDNGLGIDKEHQEKIFRLFNRLDKQNFEGTGMGLSICKKIVQMHGGKIWVESDGKTGSTFFFTIKIFE